MVTVMRVTGVLSCPAQEKVLAVRNRLLSLVSELMNRLCIFRVQGFGVWGLFDSIFIGRDARHKGRDTTPLEGSAADIF